MKKQLLTFIIFLFVVLFTTKAQEQTFPDGLSIVAEYDRVEKAGKRTSRYNHIESVDGEAIGYVNYRCGVVDASGNIIIPREYDLIIRGGDFFIVSKKSKFGLISKKGKVIAACKFNYLNRMSDRLYKTSKGNKFGIIDTDGKEVLPCAYGFIGNLSEKGTIEVSRHDNAWGIVDEKGSTIIPCIYSIIDATDDFYRVHRNGKWGVLDAKGKVQIPLEYEMLGKPEYGVCRVMKNGYLGVITPQNEVIEECKYAYINPFKNGEADACICEDMVQLDSDRQLAKYEQKGYQLIETPTRLFLMGKNPRYEKIKIKEM